MISVYLKGAKAALGTIGEEDVQFLRSQMESASPEETSFYITPATVESLATEGASAKLLGILQSALVDRREVDIELRAAGDSPMPVAQPGGEDAYFAKVDLKCLVCRGDQFDLRSAQLHTATASFFNVEWLGRTADCYVCKNCGYIHWFLR